MYHPKNQQIWLLKATMPRIKTDIPLWILFRALGFQRDKDICDLIIGQETDGTFDALRSAVAAAVAGGQDGRLRIWDFATGNPLHTLEPAPAR
jgi:DNA-directed RNA polymerase beta subunit